MSTLNQYFLRAELGQGAFATVYEALDLKKKQIVAIKIIHHKLNPATLKLIHKEVNSLLTISHPNIIGLLNYFQRDNTCYLVLDYCSGGSLQQYREIHKRLKEKQVQTIAHSLGQAIKYLQYNKIAHRDIKLANILINEKGEVKLGDLGFAKHIDEQQLLKSKAGTRTTMAPEIEKGNGKVQYTTKCDVWSFGIVIYELLYGKNPFDFKNSIMYYNQILNFPKSYHVSNLAENFIKRCLQVNPSSRISAAQIMDHPWIKGFIQEGHPQYLSVQKLNDQSIVQSLQEYNSDYLKQLLEQYDLAIVRSLEKFKLQYRKDVEYFVQCYNYVFKFFKANQILRQLFFSFMITRLDQLQSILIAIHLPTGSFQINKNFEDIIKINSQQVIKIKKSMQQLKFILSKQQKINENFNPQKKLIYQMLKIGDALNLQADKTQMWKVVGVFSRMAQINFGVYTIKMNYHQSLTPSTRKKIDQIKRVMNNQDLEQIRRKGKKGISFQKSDALTYQLQRATQRKQPSFFQEQLLRILSQTATLFE